MAKLTFGRLMAKIYKLCFLKNTRLCLPYSLVFFLLAFAASYKSHNDKIALIWKDHLATGIQIPESIIKNPASVRVILTGVKGNKGIFVSIAAINGNLVFKPLIPLSPGLGYTIWADDKVIDKVQIPVNPDEQSPVLLAIYPESDTLPENLLKFYLHFSKPMRTGQSLDYICLLDQHKDTMQKVFLNLQPELWDTSGTVLTVWLDPGRIKRGLVLNRNLGNPLKKAETYRLVISQQWKDSHGFKLAKSYAKQFVAGPRDEQVPEIADWRLNAPQAGTCIPLLINTLKPLDHYLLQE